MADDFGGIPVAQDDFGGVSADDFGGVPISGPKRQKYSGLQSFGQGAANGAQLGWAPKITAGIQSLLPVHGDSPHISERYHKELAAARQREDDARASHPWLYTGGQVVGGAAPATLAGAGAALEGAEALGAVGQTAARFLPSMNVIEQGAVLGGLGSAGESRASAGSGDWLTDVAKGTAGGAVTAGTGEALLGKALPWALKKAGTSMGRKAIQNVSSKLSVKAPLTDEAVQAASEAGAFKPLGTSPGMAERLSTARSDLGREYADKVAEMTGAGVKGPDVRELAAQLEEKAAFIDQNTSSKAIGNKYRALARHLRTETVGGEGAPPRLVGVSQEGLAASPAGVETDVRVPGRVSSMEAAADPASASTGGRTYYPEKPRLIPETNRPAPNSGWRADVEPGTPDEWNLGLEQAENIKRDLQAAARDSFSRVTRNTPLGTAKIDQASMMQRAVEGAVDRQAALSPEAAAAFIPLKRKLGPLIAASEAANVGAAREAGRRTISPYTMLMGAADISHGGLNPLTLLKMAGTHLADKRGAQTGAWAAFGGEKMSKAAVKKLLPLALAQSGLTLKASDEE